MTSNTRILSVLFLSAYVLVMTACTTPSSASLTGLDSACRDFESCIGLPAACTKDFFPEEAYGPGTIEERKERAQQIKRILSSEESSWAYSQPKPQYPRAFLKPGNLQNAKLNLRALLDEKGALSRLCYINLEGNPAFARNAAYALQSWRVSPKILSQSSFYPFIVEVEFRFRISK
jgi:outer membrane biosynthesis protein TonB